VVHLGFMHQQLVAPPVDVDFGSNTKVPRNREAALETDAGGLRCGSKLTQLPVAINLPSSL
jgi:hypothetical protein